MSKSKAKKTHKIENKSNRFTLSLTVLSVCILLLSIILGVNYSHKYAQIVMNPLHCDNITKEIQITTKNPIYWVYSQHSNVRSKTGILKHLHKVLDRLGWEYYTNSSKWDLLWSYDYPFVSLERHVKSMNPNQLLNHFPGTGFITNKVDFATSKSKFIPKAFKIPQDKEEFLKYAASKPEHLFIYKNNQHRGVTIKNLSQIDLTQQGNFVQEYVQRPLLVDGHKFDIGVFTVITSVHPLRVYIYKGDILFRFCPAQYYPFDPANVDKYVIADDYLPMWEVPSLKPLYTTMGYGMKDSFDSYIKAQGKDPSIIWKQIDEFIAEIFLQKEYNFVSSIKDYGSRATFFELMRFDFVVDEDLTVFALEANMSPNLSSAHYLPNQLLYEQMLYSILSLVGIGRYTKSGTLTDRDPEETAMRVSDRNLGVWSKECAGEVCQSSCAQLCSICKRCLTPAIRSAFARAYLEHINRNDCKRVFPPQMIQGTQPEYLQLSHLSPKNQLMYLWTQGKCNADITWCS